MRMATTQLSKLVQQLLLRMPGANFKQFLSTDATQSATAPSHVDVHPDDNTVTIY
jgi:hypothetical protein